MVMKLRTKAEIKVEIKAHDHNQSHFEICPGGRFGNLLLILIAAVFHLAEHSFLGFFPDFIQPHFLPKVNPISKSHCGRYFGNLLLKPFAQK